MYHYNKLLIPLNLTALDDAAISYAAMVSTMTPSDKAHFLHVKRPSEVPKDILEEYPQLLNPELEDRMQRMKEVAGEKFHGHSETKVVFDIQEGKPLDILLEQIVEKDIDLVLLGRKADAKETRQLPIKLARKAPCSVLVVPEGTKYSISNILVPVDFSDFCANAVELAVNIAKANGQTTIHCLHVYNLPIGYSKTGKSEEEFSEIMLNNAKNSYERFISKIDLKGIEVKPIFMLHDKPAQAIQNVVNENQIDMLVLGTRGRNAGAGLLLGSVTENIILHTRVPILAVKKKGTGLSFLEVLLKHV